MPEYIVEVNQNNTLDLPIEVRQRMALEPGDKMVMSFDNTEEHLVVGKLPTEPMEKAGDIKNVLGKPISIRE